MTKHTSVLITVAAAAMFLFVACGDDDVQLPPVEDATVDVADAAIDSSVETDGVEDMGQDTVDVESQLTSCLAGADFTVLPDAGIEINYAISQYVGYGISIPITGVSSEMTVHFQCIDTDIAPEDTSAVSYGVSVEFAGVLEDYANISIPFDLDAVPENVRPSNLRLALLRPNSEEPQLPLSIDFQENMTLGFVTFATRFPGTYQVVIADDAGESYQRTWQFRAIAGVSMGCGGASMIGFRHPEEIDIIGALGGPMSWRYLAHYIEVGGMGGFNPSPTFGVSDPYETTEEFEHPQTFNEWWFSTGEGTGGSFDRAEYVSIFQDLALAFGNLSSYSPDSPYLSAGLGLEELQRLRSEVCPGGLDTTTIPSGFYDDEFNPDGSLPVIMFCDGRANQDRTIEFDRYCDLDDDGTPDEANEGLYPGPENQPRPIQIAWAVDLDGDGQRDFDEPVIRNFHENFEDVGSDGAADESETGYDATSNPDPVGDNYDYFYNPSGTEGNWLWDDGEPYEDFGLDGVEGTPQLSEPVGYDFGEGNGVFDYNPALAGLLTERDPHARAGELTQEEWNSLTVFIDAGVRDIFNFAISGNHLAGAIQNAGENFRVYDGFHSVGNLDPDIDTFNFSEVDYAGLGDHVYLRYGDPFASEEDICYGDGKHVGTVAQIVNRLLTLLGFITARFPDGDYTIVEAPYPTPNGSYRFYSDSFGGFEQYSIILPPGHEWHACSDLEDNDGDGLNDGNDPDCEHGIDNSEGPGLGPALCSDGIDNDDDGLTDAAEDTDCADGDDTSEWPSDHPLRDARFPVIYLLHGYGQTPDDLRATVVPFASFMAGGMWQKVIVVYPDGYCGDNDRNQCNDGIDNDGDGGLIDDDDPDCAGNSTSEDGVPHALCADGVDNDWDGLIDDDDPGCISPEFNDESDCMKGNFFTNHQAWPDGSTPGPQYEDMFFDLVDHVDETYRTREPETTTETR